MADVLLGWIYPMRISKTTIFGEEYYYVGKLTLDNDNRFIDVLKQYLCGNEVYVFSKNTEDYNEYATDFTLVLKEKTIIQCFTSTYGRHRFYKITIKSH